jgi:hypothetical protein
MDDAGREAVRSRPRTVEVITIPPQCNIDDGCGLEAPSGLPEDSDDEFEPSPSIACVK